MSKKQKMPRRNELKSEIDHTAEAQNAREHLRNDKELNKAYPVDDHTQRDTADKGNENG